MTARTARISYALTCLYATWLIASAPSVCAGEPTTKLTNSSDQQGQLVRVSTDQPGAPEVTQGFIPSEQPLRDIGHGDLAWETHDDLAIADHVAISGNGATVAVGMTLNNTRLEVRAGVNGDTLFTFPVRSGGSYVAVDYQGQSVAFSGMDSAWVFSRVGQVRARYGFEGFVTGPVAISPDGRKLVVTTTDPEGHTNKVKCFEVGEANPLWTLEVDAVESVGWYGARMFLDGRRVVVNGKYHLYVVNTANGQILWSEPTYNTESPVAVSRDGRFLVTGSLAGRFRVFLADQNEHYSELWHYSFNAPYGSWISSCNISEDGGTIAVGTLDFFADRSEGRVGLFDTYSGGSPLWVSEPIGDEVADIAISRNGDVIAAASWGDLQHQGPDLLVYERHSPTPFYTLVTDGSLNSVSMSQTGLVVASGKATHNRQFGRGAQVYTVTTNIQGPLFSGRVTLRADGNPVVGAQLWIDGHPYRTQSIANGAYSLRANPPEGRALNVHCGGPGYTTETRQIADPGNIVENFNFQLSPADHPPANLRASQGGRNQVRLLWDAYNRGRWIASAVKGEILTATGKPQPIVGITGELENVSTPLRDDPSDIADSIFIYRSFISGGPYIRIGTVLGDSITFYDRSILPLQRAFYRITACFADGESGYSNEVEGWVDDQFLADNADLQSMIRPPIIDGSVGDDEWAGAVTRDISDVLGYDAPDTAGSAEVKIGFSDDTDSLYIGLRYFARHSLQNLMGMGIYVDDRGDRRWTYEDVGSEGNYWAYQRNGVPSLRYRSLTGGRYSADPYYTFQDGALAYSDARGYVEMEVALPLGFHSPEEIGLYGGDSIGLGLFAVQRDDAGNPIFNGWWPQNMFSIVTEPEQFASVHIPATLIVPPGPPLTPQVERDGSDLQLTWTDPDTGVNGRRVQRLDGINVYRNGQAIDDVRPGQGSYLDGAVADGGYYEYSVAGYVLEDDAPFEGPHSASVGSFAGHQPDITTMTFDDNTAEGYYVVDFSGDDNRFATMFNLPPTGEDTSAVYWIEFYQRGGSPMDVYLLSSPDGNPGEVISERGRAVPATAEGVCRYYFPGTSQPRIGVDPDFGTDVWVVLNYLPNTPGSPAIGVDVSNSDPIRNRYYTRDGGWRTFTNAQPMIRIGVGRPPAGVPTAPTEIPRIFSLGVAYPNPFNGMVTIPVNLPGASEVFLEAFDRTGRMALSVDAGLLAAGRSLMPISFGDHPAGTYIIRVRSRFGLIPVKVTYLK